METKGKIVLWSGRILSGVVIAFLTLDTIGKLLLLQPVVEGSAALGYRTEDIFTIGAILAVGTLLYATPRTALLGAIYLTGYLGGALASHLRIGSPLLTHVLFAVYVGAFMWLGLILRRPELALALIGRNASR